MCIRDRDGGQHKKDVFRLAPGIEDQAGQQEHCISEAGRSEKVYGQNQREDVYKRQILVDVIVTKIAIFS